MEYSQPKLYQLNQMSTELQQNFGLVVQPKCRTGQASSIIRLVFANDDTDAKNIFATPNFSFDNCDGIVLSPESAYFCTKEDGPDQDDEQEEMQVKDIGYVMSMYGVSSQQKMKMIQNVVDTFLDANADQLSAGKRTTINLQLEFMPLGFKTDLNAANNIDINASTEISARDSDEQSQLIEQLEQEIADLKYKYKESQNDFESLSRVSGNANELANSMEKENSSALLNQQKERKSISDSTFNHIDNLLSSLKQHNLASKSNTMSASMSEDIDQSGTISVSHASSFKFMLQDKSDKITLSDVKSEVNQLQSNARKESSAKNLFRSANAVPSVGKQATAYDLHFAILEFEQQQRRTINQYNNQMLKLANHMDKLSMSVAKIKQASKAVKKKNKQTNKLLNHVADVCAAMEQKQESEIHDEQFDTYPMPVSQLVVYTGKYLNSNFRNLFRL